MDVPYEHNAGTPYIWASHRDVESYELMKVAYEGPFVTPDAYHTNSPYSVEMINAGAVAWLRTEQWAKSGLLFRRVHHYPSSFARYIPLAALYTRKCERIEEKPC